jgi:SHS family lactate transporter-like MFS transporter
VAAAILSACFIPLWSAAEAPFGGIAVGGFFMQFFLQGAWGIIPIHLCELSPPNFRGFFPGFIYHCGNLVAATAAWMEMALANTFVEEDGTPDLSPAMAIFVGTALLLMVIVTLAGPEEMGRELVCSEEYRPDLWRASISRSERANTDYSFSSAPSMDFV